MKKFLGACLLALMPFVMGAGATLTGGGGSSGGVNTLNVCADGGEFTTIAAALGTLNIPYGEPVEAAYQSGATLALYKIIDGGIADRLDNTSANSAIASADRTLETKDDITVMLKRTGSPVGNIELRMCANASVSPRVCEPTTSCPTCGTLGTGTIAASAIGTAGPEVVTLRMDNAPIVGANFTAAKRQILVVRGDATYETNNFSTDYIEIVRYTGGTGTQRSGRSAIPKSGTLEGNYIYNGGGDASGPLAAYVTSSDFDDVTRNVISLCPGTYDLISADFPPYTSIVSQGRGGIINVPYTQVGYSWQTFGNLSLDNVTVTGAPNMIPMVNQWRGTRYQYVLDANTSTAAATIVINTGNGSQGANIGIGDIVIATGAVRGDGASPYYVANDFSTRAHPRVVEALGRAADSLGVTAHMGRVFTTDALFRETPELLEDLEQQNTAAIDMVTSAFLTVAQVRGRSAGAILAVSDECLNGKMGFRDPKFLQAEEKIVEIALKSIDWLTGG